VTLFSSPRTASRIGNAALEEFGPQRLSALLAGLSQEDSASLIAEQILQATDAIAAWGSLP